METLEAPWELLIWGNHILESSEQHGRKKVAMIPRETAGEANAKGYLSATWLGVRRKALRELVASVTCELVSEPAAVLLGVLS